MESVSIAINKGDHSSDCPLRKMVHGVTREEDVEICREAEDNCDEELDEGQIYIVRRMMLALKIEDQT